MNSFIGKKETVAPPPMGGDPFQDAVSKDPELKAKVDNALKGCHRQIDDMQLGLMVLMLVVPRDETERIIDRVETLAANARKMLAEKDAR